MRSLMIGLASTVLAFGLMGCTNPSASQAQTPNPQVIQNETVPTQQKADNNTTGKDEKAVQANNEKSNNKSIVVYYSRTGENYSVGNITVGNTAKVAAEIAKQAGADLFEIKPVKPYPTKYQECIEVAQQEKDDFTRVAHMAHENLFQHKFLHSVRSRASFAQPMGKFGPVHQGHILAATGHIEHPADHTQQQGDCRLVHLQVMLQRNEAVAQQKYNYYCNGHRSKRHRPL